MITLFELKNRPVLRSYYRIPYFIKNCFIMLCLAFALLVIYKIDFEKEGATYMTIYKLFQGMDSKVFNRV